MRNLRSAAFVFAISFAAVGMASMRQAATAPADANSAVAPVSRSDNPQWQKRFENMNTKAKQGGVDLVFIGDSITEGWEGAGKDVWAQHYANRHAFNLGIGGDRTQHVLWRLQHGNLDGIQPRLAVIMIGTNNCGGADNTAAEIAAGVSAIVKTVREKAPKARILLLGVFPRGEKPSPQREKIDQVNAIIAKLDDGKMVSYLDIGKRFMNADGTISADIMPDFLHLSAKGYEIWADGIEKEVESLMKTQ